MPRMSAEKISAVRRKAARARWKKATAQERASQGLNFHKGLSAQELSERNRTIISNYWKSRKLA